MPELQEEAQQRKLAGPHGAADLADAGLDLFVTSDGKHEKYFLVAECHGMHEHQEKRGGGN